jgi:flagellar protein FliJ
MATHSISVLKALKEIATKEADLAIEALAQTMKAEEEAQSKKKLLQEYRQDYINNLNNLMETGMSAEMYRNFQKFFNKLDQAVIGQEEVVEFAKQQVQVQRQLWQESQRKKLSYEVLLQRSDKRVLKAEQRKDQNMTDEFAMRISRTKHSK